MKNSLELDYSKYTDFLNEQISFRYTVAIILAILYLILIELILSGYLKESKKENSIKKVLDLAQ
jgi:hypothetical protein